MIFPSLLWTLLLCQVFLGSEVVGTASVQDLYHNGLDAGIRSFTKEELNSTLQNSNKPWLIQFYGSWCGHCQRFAPKFKELGIRVQGWTDTIGLGTINCAQDYNIEACRDYDIQGYPTTKIFAPYKNVPSGGLTIKFRAEKQLDKVITHWIEKMQQNQGKEMLNYVPDLTPFNSENPMKIWKSGNERLQNANVSILVFCNGTQVPMVNNLIMDHYHLTKSLANQTIVRKVLIEKSTTLEANDVNSQSNAIKLARSIGIRNQIALPVVVAVKRATSNLEEQSLSENCNTELLNVANEGKLLFSKALSKIVSYSRNFTSIDYNSGNLVSYKCEGDSDEYREVISLPLGKKVMDESLIKKRRNTVFMNDLENALLYSLDHEVAEKKMIVGKSFKALQNYIEVLVELFPTKGREETLSFLKELYRWILRHKTGFRGEDFSRAILELKDRFSSFHDLGDYIGCKGSGFMYGGYPCGVWSLWHVLTARQAEKHIKSPTWVLTTMSEYMDQFFGCRHCTDNFLKVSDHGNAIERDVRSIQDSILWLWKAHNFANSRLMGDQATDDPEYPKSIFPEEKYCPKCFTEDKNDLRHSTWTINDKTYDLQEVLKYLQHLYTNIDMTNLEENSPSNSNNSINVWKYAIFGMFSVLLGMFLVAHYIGLPMKSYGKKFGQKILHIGLRATK